MDSQTVTVGGKAAKPADPTKGGYIFSGWYMDAACTAAWSFDSAVTGNMMLYAGWTAIPIYILRTPPIAERPSEGGHQPADPPWMNLYGDISGNAWHYDAVQYASTHELMGGYGDGRLDPKGPATRAQVAQMLKSFMEII